MLSTGWDGTRSGGPGNGSGSISGEAGGMLIVSTVSMVSNARSEPGCWGMGSGLGPGAGPGTLLMGPTGAEGRPPIPGNSIKGDGKVHFRLTVVSFLISCVSVFN